MAWFINCFITFCYKVIFSLKVKNCRSFYCWLCLVESLWIIQEQFQICSKQGLSLLAIVIEKFYLHLQVIINYCIGFVKMICFVYYSVAQHSCFSKMLAFSESFSLWMRPIPFYIPVKFTFCGWSNFIFNFLKICIFANFLKISVFENLDFRKISISWNIVFTIGVNLIYNVLFTSMGLAWYCLKCQAKHSRWVMPCDIFVLKTLSVTGRRPRKHALNSHLSFPLSCSLVSA